MIRNGVPAAAIETAGRGQTNLLIPTADGVREAQNRRVELVVSGESIGRNTGEQ